MTSIPPREGSPLTADLVPVILAGGAGVRLWPASRRARPKPFLRIGGGKSLLERTWDRARLLAPADRVQVATERTFAALVQQELPSLDPRNLLVEPARRDTAAAAVHATWHAYRRNPDAILALLPADHWIENDRGFVEAMQMAADVAIREDALVCLGIPARSPSEGFGYVRTRGRTPAHAQAAPVVEFIEKPVRSRAESLLAGGDCAWNAGVFVWRARTFLEEVERLGGALAEALADLLAAGDVLRFFERVPAVAVDRAILERTARAWLVGADMGWGDLGSWDVLAEHLPRDADGTAGTGVRLAIDARDCFVQSLSKPVVLVGVERLVIVECDDVLLVADRSAAQQLQRVPEALRQHGLDDLL